MQRHFNYLSVKPPPIKPFQRMKELIEKRVNVKWNPPDSTCKNEYYKKKRNDAIHELVSAMVPSAVGIFYQWESKDLVVSKLAQDMTSYALRDSIPRNHIYSCSAPDGVRFIGFCITLVSGCRPTL